MKKTILIFIFLINLFHTSSAQNHKQGFKNLSSPEKCWVIFHPFKAKRAYRISLQAQKTSDSIAKTTLLDQDKNGGQVDAFRHAYWMATLAKEIGKNSAKSLGKAHEKGNYKQFKKNQFEDGTHPDKPSSEMDLFNNNIGINIFKENKNVNKMELISLVIEKIKKGKLKILKKDIYGHYNDCNGKSINLKEYKGIWETPKCLINSNLNKL
ncbi:hypothetical protein [Flavicella sp.]|uniref:DUF6973 domain-containing protein n=1 Tax=Flavicella sp. TaxID=2957742 RepID=UPI00301A7E4B